MSKAADSAAAGSGPAGFQTESRRDAPRGRRGRLGKLLFKTFSAPACHVLYRRWPGASLALAAFGGTLAARVHRPVAPEALAALLGEEPAARHRSLAASLARNEFRHRILTHCMRRYGAEPLRRVLICTGLERLIELHRNGSPAVIAVSHLGPSRAVGAAFLEAGVPLLFLGRGRERNAPASTGAQAMTFGQSPQARTLWLKAALDHLKGGGLLGMAADGAQGAPGGGPGVLGTGFQLRTGIAVLHRLSGAPVVPVTARWAASLRRIEISVGAPLPSPSGDLPGPEIESAMQQTLMKWLEAEIKARPQELHAFGLLRNLTPES